MIQLRSELQIADNTGAKRAHMIRRLGQRKKTADIGDVIVVNIKEASVDSSVKKGTVVKAVVVRTKAPIRRRDGSYLRFDSNAIVILDNNGNPRWYSHIWASCRELRTKQFMKIVSLAPEVL